jgi:hypothetical protein
MLMEIDGMPLAQHCICEQYSAVPDSIVQDWVDQRVQNVTCGGGAKSLLGASHHWAGVAFAWHPCRR